MQDYVVMKVVPKPQPVAINRVSIVLQLARVEIVEEHGVGTIQHQLLFQPLQVQHLFQHPHLRGPIVHPSTIW